MSTIQVVFSGYNDPTCSYIYITTISWFCPYLQQLKQKGRESDVISGLYKCITGIQ